LHFLRGTRWPQRILGMPRQYSIGMVPICGKVPDKCRRLATERGDLIHASHLEREKGPALVERDARGGASRLPHRLEAVEPIDARLVETGDPPSEKLELRETA